MTKLKGKTRAMARMLIDGGITDADIDRIARDLANRAGDPSAAAPIAARMKADINEVRRVP